METINSAGDFTSRDSSRKLSRKQEDAIVALLSSRNLEEAARACRTSPRTLHRWLQEPEFDEAYRSARRQAYGQSIARLQQASSAAASTLLKMMVDPNSPPACRLRAADKALSHAAKAIELEDLEARLSRLERSRERAKPAGRNNYET